MPVEFINDRGRSVSVSGAVSNYIAGSISPGEDDRERIDRLDSENSRLREIVSELIEALAGVLPNDVLTSLCGGSSRGFIRRNGSDGDVFPLEKRLDDIDKVHQEVRTLEESFDDHCGRRIGWVHGD